MSLFIIFAILLAFVCIAVALAWFLISHDHGSKEPIMALWMAFGLGAATALVAYFIENKLLTASSLLPSGPKSGLISTSMLVAVIEESCKFIPLAVILYGRRFFNEHTDGVIYFALVGLGFGLPENILYTLQLGSKTGMTRLFLTPMFHAAITAMIGYYLIKQKLDHKSIFTVVLAFTIAILLHGVYDFGLLSENTFYTVVSVTITLGLTGNLFLLYSKATDRDQDQGLSVVGHNSFCRSCGWSNPRHHLYCVHCGKNA